jgi:HEPN domain-containing protein
MTPRDRARLLVAKAQDDENLIAEVIESEQVTDEIIGFHAQQAAEKLLKALLMAREIQYRKTHDLRELIDLLFEHAIILPESLMEIRTLSPFAVDFRYDYLPSEEEVQFDRRNALEMVRQLRAWVESEI